MVGVHYLWDPVEDNIVRELDDTGAAIANYTTEPDHFGNVISQRRGGQSGYFHYDGLGSTLAVTDESANITDTRAYSAFGENAANSGSTSFPFQYVGQNGYYTDILTSEFMVRGRTYEPATARWLSKDLTSDSVQLLSDFMYGNNRPTTLIDPSGFKVHNVFEMDPTESLPHIDIPSPTDVLLDTTRPGPADIPPFSVLDTPLTAPSIVYAPNYLITIDSQPCAENSKRVFNSTTQKAAFRPENKRVACTLIYYPDFGFPIQTNLPGEKHCTRTITFTFEALTRFHLICKGSIWRIEKIEPIPPAIVTPRPFETATPWDCGRCLPVGGRLNFGLGLLC